MIQMHEWKLTCPNGHDAVVEIVKAEDIPSQFDYSRTVIDKLEGNNPMIIGGCNNLYCEFKQTIISANVTIQIGNDQEWS